MDADSLALVGTIPKHSGRPRCGHRLRIGAATSPPAKPMPVIPFDLKTLKTFPEIKVGKKPDASSTNPSPSASTS